MMLATLMYVDLVLPVLAWYDHGIMPAGNEAAAMQTGEMDIDLIARILLFACRAIKKGKGSG